MLGTRLAGVSDAAAIARTCANPAEISERLHRARSAAVKEALSLHD